MTRERYLLNIGVYIPIIAAIAGSVLYGLFAASSPEVTINWLFGLIVVCYLGGAYIARSKREVVREKLPDQADS
jgi:nicotinamide riboside transporter PnuC